MAAFRNIYNAVTLIEMLIVVAIIALLATMILTIVVRIDSQSKEKNLHGIFTLLDSALHEYHTYTGKFPDQPEKNSANAIIHIEQLYADLHSIPSSRIVLEKLNDAFLKNKAGAPDKPEIYDPWGSVLDYRYIPGENFPEIFSAGKDKRFDTPDDITSKTN
jgi:prepilin-type N-terminal cleavage/methylation domain-containing protein